MQSKRIKLSNATFRSQNVEVDGEKWLMYSCWHCLAGEGGVHGDDLLH